MNDFQKGAGDTASPPRNSGPLGRILVVEDDSFIRMWIAGVLAGMGHHVD
ncbi:MAG: hypothetical protein H7X97_04480, partial [Opitutaceae bacterium]|nr:hypothetical protein [Verrucomicrobiales bacterium]